MARLGRIVAAGFPHHVTQRGNRRQTVRRLRLKTPERKPSTPTDHLQLRMPK
jgi:GrpB-like predicted nucleotidyltransferase (UPF0157 family)